MPSSRNCATIDLAMLTGMAKPTPLLEFDTPPVSICAFTPITSPRRFIKGPPELPGLMAASVWIACGIEKVVKAGIVRPKALTMPRVRVPSSPKGLPMATTL